MAHPTRYNIWNSLIGAVKTTGVERVYPDNLPKTSKSNGSSYVVVWLPSRLTRMCKGNDDFVVETQGVFRIGVKARQDGTTDIPKSTELEEKFKKLFPISDDYITAYGPEPMAKGLTDAGYQETWIYFQIRTKVNQYLKE